MVRYKQSSIHAIQNDTEKTVLLRPVTAATGSPSPTLPTSNSGREAATPTAFPGARVATTSRKEQDCIAPLRSGHEKLCVLWPPIFPMRHKGIDPPKSQSGSRQYLPSCRNTFMSVGTHTD